MWTTRHRRRVLAKDKDEVMCQDGGEAAETLGGLRSRLLERPRGPLARRTCECHAVAVQFDGLYALLEHQITSWN